jgi:hypothetical protein
VVVPSVGECSRDRPDALTVGCRVARANFQLQCLEPLVDGGPGGRDGLADAPVTDGRVDRHRPWRVVGERLCDGHPVSSRESVAVGDADTEPRGGCRGVWEPARAWVRLGHVVECGRAVGRRLRPPREWCRLSDPADAAVDDDPDEPSGAAVQLPASGPQRRFERERERATAPLRSRPVGGRHSANPTANSAA